MFARKRKIALSFTVIAGAFGLFCYFFVVRWQPFLLLAPRFERLLYDENEWSCELDNLAPRSDVIVLGYSDHDQREHVEALWHLQGWPWEYEANWTARIVQDIQVVAMVQSNGTDLTGKKISFSHHLSTDLLHGCSRRERVLSKGYHVIFLKQVGTDRFRLVRDRQQAIARLFDGELKGLRPQGDTAESRILSLLFQQAARESNPETKSLILRQAFGWISSWKLEAESMDTLNTLTHNLSSLDAALACDAGSRAYWWDLDCATQALATIDREWPHQRGWNPLLRQETGELDLYRQDWKRNPDAWRARTIDRYGTQITAKIEHRLISW